MSINRGNNPNTTIKQDNTAETTQRNTREEKRREEAEDDLLLDGDLGRRDGVVVRNGDIKVESCRFVDPTCNPNLSHQIHRVIGGGEGEFDVFTFLQIGQILLQTEFALGNARFRVFGR